MQIAQTSENHLAVQADPWLFRYYEIAMKPLRAEDEADEDEADDDTDSGATATDSDPTTLPLQDPRDAVYFVILQRFGVPYSRLASRYGLKVAEMQVVVKAIAAASVTLDAFVENDYHAELLRLLMFHASPESIVENAYIPEWAAATMTAQDYWNRVDGNLQTLEPTYTTPVLAAASQKVKNPQRLDADGLFGWWLAAQAPGTKKNKVAARGKFNAILT